MKQYELLLKNGKVKSYDRISLFIILVNFSVFALIFIQSAGGKTRLIAAAGAVLLLLLLFVIFFIKSLSSKRDFYLYWAMYITSITWLAIGKWWAGIFVLILTVLYQFAKKPLMVLVNSENIKFTSFPNRTIKWNELNNLVLKDGILTIDFKNNKIIQAETEDSIIVNEKEFNDFCNRQLKS